jgi:YVTN family beta-propeller protein
MVSRCLLLVLVSGLGIPAAGDKREANTGFRPAFKSPLDVTVDEKGMVAGVALAGTKRLAVVELTTGRIVEESDWPSKKPPPRPENQSCHLEHLHLQRGLDEESVRSIKPGSIPGASNLRGLCITPNADWQSLVVHQRPRSQVPASQVAQGWVFTNVLTAIFVGGHCAAPLTVTLDEATRGYADPSDVVVTSDGNRVFVACAGADTVLALDFPRLQRYLEKRIRDVTTREKKDDASADVYDLPDDLAASRQFVIAKLPTQSNPRRLSLSGDGKTLVVSNYLADSLTVIDAVNLKVLRHISLGGSEPDAKRRGEILFNSAKMTFHGQFTCASCHPGGHADGLVWDLERDGVGNYKKTKSLLGVRDTAPYGWHGSSPTIADRVTGTLRTLHRHEPTDQEVDDLVAYLESLPPPQPKPVGLVKVEAVARGKALFQGKAECVKCHRGDTLQDGKTHDIGTRGPTDTQDAFDTPSLRGLGDNAPYLHDGRAESLEDVFKEHDKKNRHGAAHLLNPGELADLIAYLKHL